MATVSDRKRGQNCRPESKWHRHKRPPPSNCTRRVQGTHKTKRSKGKECFDSPGTGATRGSSISFATHGRPLAVHSNTTFLACLDNFCPLFGRCTCEQCSDVFGLNSIFKKKFCIYIMNEWAEGGALFGMQICSTCRYDVAGGSTCQLVDVVATLPLVGN